MIRVHSYAWYTYLMITYMREGSELELSFPDEPHLVEAVKSVKGSRYDATFGLWTVPDTAETWEALSDYLQDADTSKIEIPKTLEVSEKTSHPDYPYLMEHQAQVVNTALSGHKKLYLGLPAGTGKSLASFASMDALGAYPLLIVCLSVNKVNWQRELKKFAGLESQVLAGRTPGEITEDIVIINYDILKAWAPALKKIRFKGVIFDESAYIKSPDAARTKASKEVAKTAEAIMMLSGTPTPSSPHDLVAPLQILGELDKFGGSIKYIDRYCPPFMTQFGKSYSDYQNLDELHKNLTNTCFVSWRKEDLIDLPPILIYDDMVEGKSVSLNALIRAMSGATLQDAYTAIEQADLYGADGVFAKMRSETGEQKINSIIAEAEAVAEYEKVIVGVHHREVNDEVYEALSKKFETRQIIGAMSEKKRQAAIDDFQDGDAQVLVLSIVAGGVAINLQNASHMIVGELPISYAEFEQLISRIYRKGQKNKVTIKRIVCPGTADDILVGLASKKEGLHGAISFGDAAQNTNIREVLARYLVERKKEVLED